jgi:DNA-binding transcriptional ArsR family regulator
MTERTPRKIEKQLVHDKVLDEMAAVRRMTGSLRESIFYAGLKNRLRGMNGAELTLFASIILDEIVAAELPVERTSGLKLFESLTSKRLEPPFYAAFKEKLTELQDNEDPQQPLLDLIYIGTHLRNSQTNTRGFTIPDDFVETLTLARVAIAGKPGEDIVTERVMALQRRFPHDEIKIFPSEVQAVRDYMIANPYVPITAVFTQFNVTQKTIMEIRKELITAGLVPASDIIVRTRHDIQIAEQEEEIVNYLLKFPGATGTAVSRVLGMPQSSVSKRIISLRERGIIDERNTVIS